MELLHTFSIEQSKLIILEAESVEKYVVKILAMSAGTRPGGLNLSSWTGFRKAAKRLWFFI